MKKRRFNATHPIKNIKQVAVGTIKGDKVKFSDGTVANKKKVKAVVSE